MVPRKGFGAQSKFGKGQRGLGEMAKSIKTATKPDSPQSHPQERQHWRSSLWLGESHGVRCGGEASVLLRLPLIDTVTARIAVPTCPAHTNHRSGKVQTDSWLGEKGLERGQRSTAVLVMSQRKGCAWTESRWPRCLRAAASHGSAAHHNRQPSDHESCGCR